MSFRPTARLSTRSPRKAPGRAETVHGEASVGLAGRTGQRHLSIPSSSGRLDQGEESYPYPDQRLGTRYGSAIDLHPQPAKR